MQTDPYSLANLRDIVVPDEPSIWPMAPGFWIALGVVFLIVLLVVWLIYTKMQRNAYRKAGLMLVGEARTAYDVSVALKRVALAAFPREDVASLHGTAWTTFLHKTCPREYFQALLEPDIDADANSKLIELANTWILHHRVPDPQASPGLH